MIFWTNIFRAVEHWVASKVGIYATFGLIALLMAAAFTAADVDGLRLGTTFSQRTLGLVIRHPWWVLPPIACVLFFVCVLVGHLTEIPHINNSGFYIAWLFAFELLALAGLCFGSWIWFQPAPGN